MQYIWSNQHFFFGVINTYISYNILGFWHFLIVTFELNVNRQFPVILSSNIVWANYWLVFINKSIVTTKAKNSIFPCECFLLKPDNLKFTNAPHLLFGYWSNNDLDFESNWVLTEFWTSVSLFLWTQNRWLIHLKHMYLFVMSGNFDFQDQMDYISIHQQLRQCLGHIVYLFVDEVFVFVFALNVIYMIFQKVFQCTDVACIPHVNM